ncbi:MAG: shikimate kinase [Luteibaculum sp.]
MKQGQTLYLLGFMGSGKSTLGKKLAAKLKKPFLDIDHVIEAEQGRSISSLAEEKGMAFFRNLESKKLQELAGMDAVIATGGGTPCIQKNLDVILETGLSFYLRYPVATLVQRLIPGKTQRPLIANLKNEDLPKFIEGLLKGREEYYLQANYVWDFSQEVDKNPLNFILKYLE